MRHSNRWAAAVLLLAAWGCSSPTDTGPDDPDGPAPILIVGSDMGPRYQNFTISRDTASMATAVVSINGATIPTTSNGRYNYDMGHSLLPGEELVIRVEHGGDVVEGRATIAEPANLLEPIPNQDYPVGSPVTFTWTATTEPDFWLVAVSYLDHGSGLGVVDSVGASDRSHVLATVGVPASASSVTATVFGYLRGSFTGPADPASTMRVRSENFEQHIPLTLIP